VRNWLITTKPKTLEYYEGMLVHADAGLHDQAISLFRSYVPDGSSVLDIGAGAGAFATRLANAGYAVTAIDVDPGKWIPKEIPFFEVDVNSGIAGSVRDKFDAACCLEVIEHVENPWKLFRDISETLRPGGRLLLSTPNVASFLSRLIFLRSGKFHQFGDEDIAYGHINPVTPFEMETIADRAGLRVLEMQPGGYLPIFDLSSLRPRSIAFNFLRGLAYLVSAGNKRGWCTLFVMEKR